MNRLFKEGLYTSIIGILTLIFCGVMLYQGKSTAEELSGWFLFAVSMIRAKDTLIGIEGNKPQP